MNDRRKREWADRVDRVVEGLLSAEELACFHADVVRDPVLRAFYVEHVWLHGALLADRARLPELLAVSPPVAVGGALALVCRPRSRRLGGCRRFLGRERGDS